MELINRHEGQNPGTDDLNNLKNNNETLATEAFHGSQSQSTQQQQQQLSSTIELGATGQNAEPLFQVKKWNLFAFWKWDAHSDVCAICRANVMDACPTCQSENTTSECVIVWGTCNHSFHNCCIVKWVKRNNRCPLCQQAWKDCKKRQLN